MISSTSIILFLAFQKRLLAALTSYHYIIWVKVKIKAFIFPWLTKWWIRPPLLPTVIFYKLISVSKAPWVTAYIGNHFNYWELYSQTSNILLFKICYVKAVHTSPFGYSKGKSNTVSDTGHNRVAVHEPLCLQRRLKKNTVVRGH